MERGYQVSAQKFIYYHCDNAFFRKPAESDAPWVTEVLHSDQWMPYKGDAMRPHFFGDVIGESELPMRVRKGTSLRHSAGNLSLSALKWADTLRQGTIPAPNFEDLQ